MDKRINYIMVLDTETTNTIQEGNNLNMQNVLVYDCGWQIVDKRGNVYKQASYINKDIFIDERELMSSAYYANKIPQYLFDLYNGIRTLATTFEIRRAMLDDIREFNIKYVTAHNTSFDLNALNTTLRYITKSKLRFWFPYHIEFWDTMRMSESVVCKMPTYIKFCEDNNFLTKTGKPRKSAEVLWRYISKDPKFKESHTGLEDVIIETKILAYCFRQHKQMKKDLFTQIERPPMPTAFQFQLMESLRKRPVIAGFEGM